MSADLFSYAASYPEAPGYRPTDTSYAAAKGAAVKAATLRGKVLRLIEHEPLTADECAAALRESVLSIRPRLTELRIMGKIVDAGFRRANASGRSAIVWRRA